MPDWQSGLKAAHDNLVMAIILRRNNRAVKAVVHATVP